MQSVADCRKLPFDVLPCKVRSRVRTLRAVTFSLTREQEVIEAVWGEQIGLSELDHANKSCWMEVYNDMSQSLAEGSM